MQRREWMALMAGMLCARDGLARAAANRSPFRTLDRTIEYGLTATHTPALAAAVVRGDRTVFARGYGYADVAASRCASADTAFYVASVGKVVTATVLMMFWEAGVFALDDPVAAHLDFALSHPRYPDAPITFRQLLTHTSGLSDQRLFSMDPNGSPSELREWLIAYLTPSGLLFDPDRCFAAKPGQQWAYCNVGYALLGYLVGRLGSEPLDRFSQHRLFAPLGMKNTAWRYTGLRDEQIAERYEYEQGQYQRLPRPAYPDWPDGLLVTSAADFVQLLRVFTHEGSGILKPDTVARMFAPDPITVDEHDPGVRQALMWELHSQHGICWATKSGNDAGATALVTVDPARHTAALEFANRSSSPELSVFQHELTQRLLLSRQQLSGLGPCGAEGWRNWSRIGDTG